MSAKLRSATSRCNSDAVLRPLSLRRSLPSSSLQRAALAVSVSLAVLGTPAQAQSVPAEAGTLQLEPLKIEDETLDTNPYAEKGAPYKARTSGDRRRTETLLNTPATISVLTQTQIKESGLSDLRDIVGAQPGITIGTGENGNAFGDRYVIRGQEARSDVFIDGLRDPGMTIRESFAVEQVEITKGPSSTFAGRGSSGGTINSITKRASTDYQFNEVELGLGTDKYRRIAVDTNLPLGQRGALRVNLLSADEDVPDRAPADRARDGAAISALFQPTDRIEILADVYGLDAAGAADLGTYLVGGTRPRADLGAYLQDEDFLESTVRIGTLRLAFEASDTLRFENAARYGETENGYVLTGARGGTRGASDPSAPGAPTVTLSTHQGWQEVEYFVDQFNAYWNPVWAGREHRLVLGGEYSDLKVINGNYTVSNGGAFNCRTGNGSSNNAHCILDGQGGMLGNVHQLLQRQITRAGYKSDYHVDTYAIYALDSVDLTDQLMLTAGLRRDSFDYGNVLRSNAGVLTPYRYSDSLWNGNLGLTWKLSDAANLYLAWASASDINGGESDVGGSCGYGGLCGTAEQVVQSEPERVTNIELGSKWELFDDKLLASAAVFQITKDDVMESVGNAYSSLGTLNTGKNRVRGLELGLSGNLTARLSAQVAATVMESEVLEAFVANQVGKVLSNFADTQAFLQLRYQATPRFVIGGAATYSSEMFAGQPDTAAGFNATTGEYSQRLPGYTTWDVFAGWNFSKTVELRLNVDNLFDKNYYLAAYRSGSFVYIGDARNANLTLSLQF